MKNANEIMRRTEEFEKTASGLWIRKNPSIEVVSPQIILQENETKQCDIKLILLGNYGNTEEHCNEKNLFS